MAFLRKEYRERKEMLDKALGEYMPDQVQWTSPLGGFYFWLRFPNDFSSTELFERSRERGVVFVTGRTFDPHNERDNCLRLAFSNMPRKHIEPGIRILSEEIRKIL